MAYIKNQNTYDMSFGHNMESFPFIPRSYRILQKGLNYGYF